MIPWELPNTYAKKILHTEKRPAERSPCFPVPNALYIEHFTLEMLCKDLSSNPYSQMTEMPRENFKNILTHGRRQLRPPLKDYCKR